MESGKYSTVVGHNFSTSNTHPVGTYYGTVYLTLGNDIDRALNDDNKLSIYNRTTISCGYGYVGQTNLRDKAFLINVKSGTIGRDYFTDGGSGTGNSAYAGIYVGGFGYINNTSGWNATYYYDYSDRYLLVEGGKIANIIGGLRSNSAREVQTRLYIKGGNVLNIVGGSGVSTANGDRMIQVTGGTVQYSVCGGSNGVAADSENDNGKLNGKTLVYVGGTAQIGTTSTVGNPGLYGTPGGCVLGAGNGTDDEDYNATSGQVDSSRVIINGGTILNSVFGGRKLWCCWNNIN